MSYRVLARQYRPTDFTAIVGQQHVVKALTNALRQQRLHHAYLLSGHHGSGKTTLGRVIAKALSCQTGITDNPCGDCDHCKAIDAGTFIDLIEVDAASRTKVDDIRELLDNVQYMPSQGRYKIYLIDEVHMLSNHSFNALLKTLEEPPEYIKFILATTEPKKLPITVLSRCLQFNLTKLQAEDICHQLANILDQENIPYQQAALESISQAAKGSMRDALSLLDQAIAYCAQDITTDAVRKMLGFIEKDSIYAMVRALADGNLAQVMTIVDSLSQQTCDFQQVANELLSVFHQLARQQLLAGSDQPEIIALASQLSPEDVQLYYQIGTTAKQDLLLAPSMRIGFEMMLLRMFAFTPVLDPSSPPSGHSTAQFSKPTAPPKAANSTLPLSVDWPTLSEQLAVSGAAKALLQHCQLKSYQEGEMVLLLASNHAPLLNDSLKERIHQALNQYFQQSITLVMMTTEEALTTPATIKQAKNQQQQQAAEEKIKKDPNISSIIKQFDAIIMPGATQPVSKSSNQHEE